MKKNQFNGMTAALIGGNGAITKRDIARAKTALRSLELKAQA